jgi:hypothetical protein
MNSIFNPHYRVISNHGIAEIRQRISNGQNSLFALRSFKKGEQISPLSAGITSDTPTYLTMQLDIGKHITMVPEFLQYINHSCDPNTFFDTTEMQVIALKNIKEGEELTFFYPSSEWEMQQPFQCYCGSSHCLGQIRGAAFIPDNVLKQYRLTDFIQQQMARRANKKVRA